MSRGVPGSADASLNWTLNPAAEVFVTASTDVSTQRYSDAVCSPVTAALRPDVGASEYGVEWFQRVETSLRGQGDAWRSLQGEGLGQGDAWILLSWVESAAAEIVRRQWCEGLELAAFAMGIILSSDLDPRDVLVIGSLVRRASHLAKCPYDEAIDAGISRLSQDHDRLRELLRHVSSTLPATHEEFGEGANFAFGRSRDEVDWEGFAERQEAHDGWWIQQV